MVVNLTIFLADSAASAKRSSSSASSTGICLFLLNVDGSIFSNVVGSMFSKWISTVDLPFVLVQGLF